MAYSHWVDTYPSSSPNFFTFTKTTETLYVYPPAIVPFTGENTATFVLERLSGGVWVEVERATTNVHGVVSFNSEPTPSTQFRLREVAVTPIGGPGNWVLPDGYWLLQTNSAGIIISMPVARGGNPPFRYNPVRYGGLFVGNLRMPDEPLQPPTPPPSPDRLVFTKTTQALYGTPSVIEPFPGTATFVLDRLSGGEWVPIPGATATNNAAGLVTFGNDLSYSATYRIRETAVTPADIWVLPNGYWRFTTDAYGQIQGIPHPFGGNPEFVVHNPATATGDRGFHVGNMLRVAIPTPSPPPPPTSNLLSFRLTTNQLYDSIIYDRPAIINPLPNATGAGQFALSRQTYLGWLPIQFASADANGWVTFPSQLTASASYRITANLSRDWIPALGYWRLSTNAQGQWTHVPIAQNGNPPFINNPRGHIGEYTGASSVVIPGLHVGFAPNDDIIISSATQLLNIGGPESTGRTFVLDKNITLPRGWESIEDFRGTLDGNGHVITVPGIGRHQHFATNGLFGTISRGNVTIRNVAVIVNSGESIRAYGITSGNSRAFAGGLIGQVIGGNVTIENAAFYGNVRARSNYDKVMQQYYDNPIRFFLRTGVEIGLSHVSGALKAINYMAKAGYYTYHIAYAAINAYGSYSYAGGFIGSISGSANVTINNSFVAGTVTAQAYQITVPFTDWSLFFGATQSITYAGGFVGRARSPATLTITNSYTNICVSAHTDAWFVNSCGGANVGALVGNAHIQNISRNFRFHDRGVNGTTTAGIRSGVNRNLYGVTSLSYNDMRRQSAFTDWNFNTIWTMNSNNGFPIQQIIAPNVVSRARIYNTYTTIFGTYGFEWSVASDSPIQFTMNMPYSSLDNVMVNDTPLTRGQHFTATSGSTNVALLPGFLQTLDEGYHTITVNFTCGTIAETDFLILEAIVTEVRDIYRLYLNDVLVYYNNELQVSESQLDAIQNNPQSIRIELEDGSVAENTNIQVDSRSTIYGNFTIPNPQAPLTIELRHGDVAGSIITTSTTPVARLRGLDSIDFLFGSLAPGTYSLVFHQPGHTSFTINNIVVVDYETVNLSENDPRFPAQLPLHPGNTSGQGQINVMDLAILLRNWQGNYENADFTGSGQINEYDLKLMLLNWKRGATVVD